jgi:hypothetical protein
MDNANPRRVYHTRQDYYKQKSMIQHCTNESSKKDVCKLFSKHNIVNAFMNNNLPLSDQKHGIFCMTPPEQLHTTSEGLTKYIIDLLRNTIGDVGKGKKLLNKIENLHHTLHFDLKRNSERDLPRGSARNGALKNTLVSATKCRGNMFRLLCLCHTDAVREDLNTSFRRSSINPQTFFKCLKLYLLMEEWFHDNNIKREVNLANSLVYKTLEMIQNVFS